MAPSCGCGTLGGVGLPKKIDRKALEDLTVQTRLKANEVKALYARFRRLAPSGSLLPDQFKQTMGVLGITDDPFLPDRMFRVFDADGDGKLSFREFATSLAIMIRGTEDEKIQLSFQIAAGSKDASCLKLDDFHGLISACHTMVAGLVAPTRKKTSAEQAEKLFHDLASGESDDGGDVVLTLEDYNAAAHESEEFLACLGLEPHIQSRRGRWLARAAPSPQHTTWAPATSPQRSVSPQHTATTQEQIEELRNLVDAIKQKAVSASSSLSAQAKRLQREPSPRRPYHNPLPEPGPPMTVLEGEEPWLTPLCSCMPIVRPSPSLSPPVPSPPLRARIDPRQEDIVESESFVLRDLESGDSHAAEALLEEVCSELDGLVGWCDQISAADLDMPLEPLGSPMSPADRRITTLTSSSSASLPSQLSPQRSAKRQVKSPSMKEPIDVNVGQASTTLKKSVSISGAGMRPRRPHRLLGPKKGLAVHFGHESWNMVLSMMIGIRMSVARATHEMARELQPVDFIMKEKFSIIPRLANIFDSQVSKKISITRFIDFAPLVFQRIRTSFGINQDEYLHSVGPEQLLGNMVLGNLSSLSELSSEGKSGAFFYYTADGKYMMKTVTQQEHSLLSRMLKAYYDHITQNPGTLIVRFLGLHCLSLKRENKGRFLSSAEKLHFVVMGNMFNTPLEIHRRYDLKGSWVGRQTSAENFDPSVALKDVDFRNAMEHIHIGAARKAELFAQIKRDSEFLRDNNVIDYSLLLGIHDIGPNDESIMQNEEPAGSSGVSASVASANVSELPLHQRQLGGMLSSDKKSVYSLGIIDILTPYDTRKKIEHFFKSLRYDRKGISCCPPAYYAERFVSFMHEAID